jgi:hypothetical protein
MQRSTLSKKIKSTEINIGDGWGLYLFFSLSFVCFLVFRGAGGGSVRRRNTLHEVGGRQLLLSQARFMGREKILLFYENKIIIFVKKCENVKSILS